MTHPNEIADKVVTDIRGNSAALAALGSGAVASKVTRLQSGVDDTYVFESVQDMVGPAVMVASTSPASGPGQGVWWIVQLAIFVRLGEGGDYNSFWKELLDEEVSGQKWSVRCLITGSTTEPMNLKMQPELFGLVGPVIQIPVIRFTIEDHVM